MAVLDLPRDKSSPAQPAQIAESGEGVMRVPLAPKFRLTEWLLAPFRDIDEGLQPTPKPDDKSGHPRGVRREPRLAMNLPSNPPETPR
jgi:hypothetical protein